MYYLFFYITMMAISYRAKTAELYMFQRGKYNEKTNYFRR